MDIANIFDEFKRRRKEKKQPTAIETTGTIPRSDMMMRPEDKKDYQPPVFAPRVGLPIADQIAENPINTPNPLETAMAQADNAENNYPRPQREINPADLNSSFAPQIPEAADDNDYDEVTESRLFSQSGAPTAPLSVQDQLNEEYAKKREFETSGAKKENGFFPRLLEGALRGLASGGLGGALVGGAVEGFYPKANTKFRTEAELNKTNSRIGELRGQQDFESQQADAAVKRDYMKAQTEFQRARPQIEQDKLKSKFELESQKQINRLQVLQEKEAVEGKKWKLESRNGKFYKKYADREEPLINPTTGEQERDLINEPVETTAENGQKGFAKFGTILSTEATKAYRDATLQLGRERLDETRRSNQANEDIRREQMAQAKTIARERMEIARENLRMAQERFNSAQEKDRRAADREVQKQKQAIIRLKAYLKNNPLISDDPELLSDIESLDQ